MKLDPLLASLMSTEKYSSFFTVNISRGRGNGALLLDMGLKKQRFVSTDN